jgi:hypothetical protein
MSEQKTYPFLTGVSTRPDVDSLIRAFPPESIRAGEWRASYEELKQHLGRCEGNRLRTVLSNWERRLKREFRVQVKCERGFGYYCPTAADVLNTVPKVLDGVGRKIRIAAEDAALASPTNQIEKDKQEHYCNSLAKLRGAVKETKQLVLPSTKSQQVQIVPPKLSTVK